MNITKEALEFTKSDLSQKLHNTEKVTLPDADRERLQKEYREKLSETEKQLEQDDTGN